MSQYTVSDLYIYPVKSLAGISMPEVSLCKTGFTHDRRWMLVDEHGIFISQREHHNLCLFTTHYTKEGFLIRHQSDEIFIPFELHSGNILRVMIWDDPVSAKAADHAINSWFSARLNMNVRLVYMPDSSKRNIDRRYRTGHEDVVSFADAYPVLTIGEASLALLQSRVEHHIPMDRFRPNLVFTGGKPHDEDTWKRFVINGQCFYGVKPCARCVITTIDQQTGIAYAEPLKTLATYRKKEHKILFGQNVISPVSGTIRIGDTITVDKTTDQLFLQ